MIEYKYFDFFKADSTHKKLTLFFNDGTVFDNEKIWEESLELKEALCEEKNLFFGSCESSELKIKIWNSGSYIGKKIDVIMQIEDFAEQLPIGKFIVVSDKPTADKKYRDIIAYDLMYEIIKSDVAQWYNTILPDADSEITLKEFRNSFFEYFGIEQESVELVNDSMIIQKTIETNSLSGKDVITAICEINGCFGHIGRDGKFKYIFLKEMKEGLYPSDTLYPSDNLFPRDAENAELVSRGNYINATYEDFITAKINKLQIRQEEDDIGVIHGTGDNCYIVQDNFLVYGKGSKELEVIASNLYSVICNVWYRPAHVEAKGNPCLEVGDGIRLGTRYEKVFTYILQRTLRGIQALRDTYDAEGEQYQRKDVNSNHESLIQLKARANKLTRTIEETRLEISAVDRDLKDNYYTTEEMNSLIEQSAEEISTEVNKKITETRTYADGVAEEARIKALSAASSDATDKANQAQINAIADTNEKLKSYSTKIEMTSAINQKANEITLSVNEQITETKTYADNAAESAESNANSATNEKLKSYSTTVEMNSAISAKANEIALSVSEIYETKEDSNKKRDELSSSITLNANNITAEVKRAQAQEVELAAAISINADNISLKVSKGSVSSEISQESGKISIKSNRFSLQSTNCTIQEDGTISAKNVDLTGKITANSGEIGGLTISSNSIYYNKSSFANAMTGIYIGRDGIAVGYGYGTQAAFSVSANGNVFLGYDKDIETKGGIDFTSVTYAKIKFSGTERIAFDQYGLDLKGNISICDTAGQNLSFFGGAGSTRKSITNITSTSTATASSVATKLNELIDALQAYNLIG